MAVAACGSGDDGRESELPESTTQPAAANGDDLLALVGARTEIVLVDGMIDLPAERAELGYMTLIGAREAGSAVPTIEILTPADGESLSRSDQIEWAREDTNGDPITYTVLTSTGDGRWRSAGTERAGASLSLRDADPTLRAGDQLLIVVSASDGLNSMWTAAGPIPVS